MAIWNNEQLSGAVNGFDSSSLKDKIKKSIEDFCSYEQFLESQKFTEEAVGNNISSTKILDGATQQFPDSIDISDIKVNLDDLKKYGIVITAGGEGERLMLSLLEKGYSEDELADFTKATFPIPDLPNNFGALQLNLALLSELSQKIGYDIPVIVTTGPKGTTTARVIPKVISENSNFGLKNIKVIEQNERLHLTAERKIAFKEIGDGVKICTNPDETGGPLMKLKEVDSVGGSTLDWLESLGASKIMVLQGTAIYDRSIPELIATAGVQFDGMGIGISRSSFEESDPYGTFVSIEQNGQKLLSIIEANVRTQESRKLQDEQGNYLPFNTGFYAFDISLLKDSSLPPYASPNKQVLPEIESAPKTGFAATDIVKLARNGGVLTISDSLFSVIKNSDDLLSLSAAAKVFKLIDLCKK
jgi:hypothetical protein